MSKNGQKSVKKILKKDGFWEEYERQRWKLKIYNLDYKQINRLAVAPLHRCSSFYNKQIIYLELQRCNGKSRKSCIMLLFSSN